MITFVSSHVHLVIRIYHSHCLKELAILFIPFSLSVIVLNFYNALHNILNGAFNTLSLSGISTAS